MLQEGDIVAVAGPREVLVDVLGQAAQEVEDPELLDVPVEGVDVYVTSKDVDGKTLAELAAHARRPRRVPAQDRARRHRDLIPILPNTKIHRGDILTIVGRDAGYRRGGEDAGRRRPCRAMSRTSRSSAARSRLGALIGALVLKVGGVPLTLSTAGGALIAGLVFGWLRSVQPDLRPHSLVRPSGS